jgi:hypothetical protein
LHRSSKPPKTCCYNWRRWLANLCKGQIVVCFKQMASCRSTSSPHDGLSPRHSWQARRACRKGFTAFLTWYVPVELLLVLETDISQLADTLILKHQRESAKTNNYLVHLTKDTVDDSATVRVVTFVTLIYLPASFIAVCIPGLVG